MAKAKDLVPAGTSLQLKGRETFCPPAPGITYLMGIVPFSAKTEEVISMASPPVGINKIAPKHQTPKITKDLILFIYLTCWVFPDIL
jgi:hypothetical protein